MAITSPSWTQRDALAFTAGTLSTISDCVGHIEQFLKRGTLSNNTTPTSSEVQNFLVQGKQELIDEFGFTWKRKFSYAAPAAGEWQLGLPADFGGGAYVVRDLSSDKRMSFVEQVTFDTLYPDVAGSAQAVPKYYTIKDRELWLHAPANGTYTIELEYNRTGDDSSTTDISYIPQLFRFRICDYAAYRSFMALQQWDAANIYKSEWMQVMGKAKKGDGRKKWAAQGYMAKSWYSPG